MQRHVHAEINQTRCKVVEDGGVRFERREESNPNKTPLISLLVVDSYVKKVLSGGCPAKRGASGFCVGDRISRAIALSADCHHEKSFDSSNLLQQKAAKAHVTLQATAKPTDLGRASKGNLDQ